MPSLPAALLLVVAAGLASGCADTPAAPRVEYVTIDRPVNDVVYQPCLGFAGDADLAGFAATLPDGRQVSHSVFDNGASMEVPANTTALVLDMWWQGGAATAVRAQVVGPDGATTMSDPRTSATREDPIRLRFDHPMPGAYRWTGVADPVAAGVVLHLNEGLYFETPESLGFLCNAAGPMAGG